MKGGAVIYGTGRYRKHYVAVLALHRVDGWVVPIQLIWDDGRRFGVEVLTDGRRCRCQRTDGYAVLFRVRIRGTRTRNLYRDEEGWFVETLEGSDPSLGKDPRNRGF